MEVCQKHFLTKLMLNSVPDKLLSGHASSEDDEARTLMQEIEALQEEDRQIEEKLAAAQNNLLAFSVSPSRSRYSEL